MWRMGERTRGEGCRVMLRHCLAIIVRKEGCQGDPGDFWMYESGYLLFQVMKSILLLKKNIKIQNQSVFTQTANKIYSSTKFKKTLT